MTMSENPYESPRNSEPEGKSKPDPSDFDIRGMLSLIVGIAILGGVDYWLLNVGVFLSLIHI